MRVEPFKRPGTANSISSRPGSLSSIAKSESPVPNIAVVPPTPDYIATNKTVIILILNILPMFLRSYILKKRNN